MPARTRPRRRCRLQPRPADESPCGGGALPSSRGNFRACAAGFRATRIGTRSPITRRSTGTGRASLYESAWTPVLGDLQWAANLHCRLDLRAAVLRPDGLEDWTHRGSARSLQAGCRHTNCGLIVSARYWSTMAATPLASFALLLGSSYRQQGHRAMTGVLARRSVLIREVARRTRLIASLHPG
jgi:hypothetical protein